MKSFLTKKQTMYVPLVNPLAKTQYVRPTLTIDGFRKGFFRRPKFRKDVLK